MSKAQLVRRSFSEGGCGLFGLASTYSRLHVHGIELQRLLERLGRLSVFAAAHQRDAIVVMRLGRVAAAAGRQRQLLRRVIDHATCVDVGEPVAPRLHDPSDVSEREACAK